MSEQFRVEVDWTTGDRLVFFENGVGARMSSADFYDFAAALLGSMDQADDRMAMRARVRVVRQRFGLHPRIPMIDLRRASCYGLLQEADPS